MLQRAMAAEAEASREARAKVMKTDATFYFLCLMARYLKVIAADGEMRASKALREASQIIEQSPAALQLRYLQVSCQSCNEFPKYANVLLKLFFLFTKCMNPLVIYYSLHFR